MSPTPLIEITPIPGKGMGVRAKKGFKRGEVIMSEKPVCIVNKNPESMTEEEVETSIRTLSVAEQAEFRSLADGAKPWFTPMVRKYSANGFYHDGVEPVTFCICLKMSRLNHSCVPNAVWSWHTVKCHYEVRATVDIPAGEEISICYFNGVHSLYDAAERAAYIARVYNFKCDCRACQPTDFGRCSDLRRKLLSQLKLLREGQEYTFASGHFVYGPAKPHDKAILASYAARLRHPMYWYLTVQLMLAEGLADAELAYAWNQFADSAMSRLSQIFMFGSRIMIRVSNTMVKNAIKHFRHRKQMACTVLKAIDPSSPMLVDIQDAMVWLENDRTMKMFSGNSTYL